MAVVMVGGQARKVGKTSVMTGLIAAMPEMQWTAIKITSHPHGSGESIDIFVETDAAGRSDTSRYLAAGAWKALWIRAGDLALALPRIHQEIAEGRNVMIESNGIRAFLTPDVFVGVMDEDVAEVKESAIDYLPLADAWLIIGECVPQELGKPPAVMFRGSTKEYCPASLVEFVRDRVMVVEAKSKAPIARGPAS